MTGQPPFETDERFADWVDGRMTARDLERFEAEMRVNPELRQRAEAYERTVMTVRRALRAPASPVDVADAVLGRIAAGDRMAPRPAPWRFASRRAMWFSSAVAASVFALLALLIEWRPTPQGTDVAVAERTAEGREPMFDADVQQLGQGGAAGTKAPPPPSLADRDAKMALTLDEVSAGRTGEADDLAAGAARAREQERKNRGDRALLVDELESQVRSLRSQFETGQTVLPQVMLQRQTGTFGQDLRRLDEVRRYQTGLNKDVTRTRTGEDKAKNLDQNERAPKERVHEEQVPTEQTQSEQTQRDSGQWSQTGSAAGLFFQAAAPGPDLATVLPSEGVQVLRLAAPPPMLMSNMITVGGQEAWLVEGSGPEVYDYLARLSELGRTQGYEVANSEVATADVMALLPAAPGVYLADGEDADGAPAGAVLPEPSSDPASDDASRYSETRPAEPSDNYAIERRQAEEMRRRRGAPAGQPEAEKTASADRIRAPTQDAEPPAPAPTPSAGVPATGGPAGPPTGPGRIAGDDRAGANVRIETATPNPGEPPPQPSPDPAPRVRVVVVIDRSERR